HSIAVVGASQREARGNRVIRNLLDLGFDGPVYPINPKYSEVMGLPCYPDLSATPGPVDCAVVAIPARGILPLLESAADVGVPAAVVLASGFGEAGDEGRVLQQQLRDLATRRSLLICGPNCYGMFNVATRAAAFSGDIPAPLLAGDVALISQSGGFTNVIANPLMEIRGVGFSYLVSCGNQADVTVEEYIRYFVDDEQTRVIAAFVEGFKRPRDLLAVGKKALRKGKPVIILKVGRSAVAGEATFAHTGSLAGTGEVATAAFEQSGIVQVFSLQEMIETISLFSCRQIWERYHGGTRLAVLTGSGGECGFVADMAADHGLELPLLTKTTQERLQGILPSFGSPRNPLDGTGAMYEDLTVFPRLLETLLKDPELDLVAVHLDASAPKVGGSQHSRGFRDAIAAVAVATSKPLVCFSAAAGARRDPDILLPLRDAGVPFLDGTEFAMAACRHLDRYHRYRERCQTTDVSTQDATGDTPDMPALPAGILSTPDAFQLLDYFGIPVTPYKVVTTADEAVAAATRLGFPVALKVESPDIQHKSDIGGVVLGVADAAEVRAACARIEAAVQSKTPEARRQGILVQSMAGDGVEVILGIKRDPVFGPAVICGLGGIFVEVLRDFAVGLPPLSRARAAEMLECLRGWPLLVGRRGQPPADVAALCDTLVCLSRLAVVLGERVEALDINPLVVYPRGQGVVVVDALVHRR
ncbi:MAG: acetate--CoA ligase family protein, partial [Candidatus Tectomicrobia bacterium]